jgi:hypothetical protein
LTRENVAAPPELLADDIQHEKYDGKWDVRQGNIGIRWPELKVPVDHAGEAA